MEILLTYFSACGLAVPLLYGVEHLSRKPTEVALQSYTKASYRWDDDGGF